jgi:hypothetical protein
MQRLNVPRLGLFHFLSWATHSKKRSRWPLLIALIFLLLIIPVVFYLSSRTKTVAAAWWNPGWGYRKRVDVANSSGSNLTDFQISFTLDTASLITANKLQADCDDLRITNHQGTELPYWIEENSPGCNNAATKIWVKLPAIPSSGGSLFLYYGNAQASKSVEQNGNKVFVFFDDFSAATIDSSKWTQGVLSATSGTNFSISSGKLVGGNTNRYIQSINTFTGDYVAETRTYETTAVGNGFTSISFYASLNNTIGILNHTGTFYVRNDTNWPSYGSYTKDQWEHNKIKVVGTAASLWKIGETSGSLTGAPTNSGISGEYLRLGPRGDDWASDQNYSASWDWIYVRKAVTTEPTTTTQSEETTPGPVAYWKFDEGSGTTTKDAINGNNGTINGAEWKPETECVSGKCLYFDGTTDFVSSPNNATLNPVEQLTVSLWVKNQRATAKHTFLLKKANGSGGYGLYQQTNDSISFFVYYPAGSPNYQFCEVPTYVLPKDQWTHITGEYKANNYLKVFINGIEKVNCAPTQNSNLGVDSSTFQLGYQGWWGADNVYFKGYMDEVKVFPYARTQEQILQDYNLGAAVAVGQQQQSYMSEGLVGHWKMDEVTGTSVADASGNGRTGTLMNAQETGTGEAAGTTTALVDADNTALSADDDTYNDMFLEITGGGGCGIATGQRRLITDYTGASKTITLGVAFAAETDNCTFLIDHHAAGKFGSSLAFSGKTQGSNTGDGVAVPLPAMAQTSAFTWYKFHSRGTSSNTVMRMDNDDIGITVNPNGQSRFHIDAHSTLSKTITIPTSYDGNWHQIGLTYDGTTMTAYFDGQAIGTKTGTYSIAAGNLVIGDRMDYYYEHFNGWVDETRVYNRTLKPEEVMSLFRSTPGPIAHWKMDEGLGTTTSDSSGNGNTATFQSAPVWISGKYGNGIEFDNTTDYMKVTGVEIGANNWTISAWSKFPLANNGSWRTMVRQGGSHHHVIVQSDGQLGTYSPTFFSSGFDVDTLSAGWHYLTAIGSGSTTTFYVDGKQVGIANAKETGPIVDIGGIGSQNWGGLDDLIVYNYARNTQQVIQDMNAGHPPGGSPVGSQVAYYKFDEGNGTTAHNVGSAGSALDTALSGATIPTWSNSGKIGKALSFDGVSSYVTKADNDALDLRTTGFTGSAWVNAAATTPHDILIEKGASSVGTAGYWFGISTSGVLDLYISDGTSYMINGCTGTANIANSSWHYVAFVWDPAVGGKIYVDGNLDKTCTSTTTTADINSTAPLNIGGYSSGTYTTNGLIDEVKLYNSALTVEQIKLDMNQGASAVYGGQNEAADLTDGAGAAPISEWKFDEKTGTSIFDISGNNRTGTLGGDGLGTDLPSWKSSGSCKFGACLNFDGSEDYITAGANPITGTAAFTLQGWIKADTHSTYGLAATIGNAAGNQSAYIGWVATAQSGTSNSLGGGFFGQNYGSGITDTNWHLVAMTFAGGTSGAAKIFVDGVEKVSTTITPNLQSTAIYFGKANTGTSYYFHGNVDQVSLYNYARTPAQVAYDFNRGGPIAHWKLDECQGTTLNDSSGNNYFGTWSGSGGTQTSAGTCTTASTAWGNGVSGKFNGSLNFDATDDQMLVTTNSQLDLVNSPITISAWVNWNGGGIGNYIVDKNSNKYSLTLNGNGNHTPRFYTPSTGSLDAPNQISANVWHLITATHDGTTAKLYVDGTLVNQLGGSSNRTAGGDLAIGCYATCSANYSFDGQIDDVQIFNYALSADQIGKLYNGGAALQFSE